MRRSVLGGLTIVLSVLLLAAPASAAGTVTVPDRAGDGQGVGDVLALRYSQNQATTRFTFQVRLAHPTRRLAATWTNPASASELRFNIAANDGPNVDYVLRVRPGDSGPTVALTGIARGVCAISLSFPQPDIVRVQVGDPTCFGGAKSIRVFSRFRYDQGGNGSIDSADRTPDAGFGPILLVNLAGS